MTALFIDSTYDITLGILDDDLEWVEFSTFAGLKASTVIQKEAHQLLSNAGVDIRDLSSVLTVAGPGFYTGLRLSEGFADVLTFSGIKNYSFLSYSIPAWTGVESGVWMTKAYRGEYFFHLWNEQGSQNKLVATKELENFLASVDKSNFYIHSEPAVDEFSRKLLPESRKTSLHLLQKNSHSIFKRLFETESKVDSYYFRAPEDEFKVSL